MTSLHPDPAGDAAVAEPRGGVRARLAAAGIALPEPHPTEFAYVPLAIHERTAFLAGQIPKTGSGRITVAGRVGGEVSLAEAQAAARVAAQQGLAWLDALAGGLDNVARVLRMDCFVAVAEGFQEMSRVADTASGLLETAFGAAGRHPRSVIGVSRLPRNAPLLLELTVALRSAPAEAADTERPDRQTQEKETRPT